MSDISQYLLTVIVGAVLCTLVSSLQLKSASNGALIKLLSEIFMLVLVVSPLVKINIPNIAGVWEEFSASATNSVEQGQSYAFAQGEQIIKDAVVSYILDKAAQMDADISVEVELSDSAPQIPVGVVIYGDVSPYTKSVIKTMITNELGVPEDAQIWN